MEHLRRSNDCGNRLALFNETLQARAESPRFDLGGGLLGTNEQSGELSRF